MGSYLYEALKDFFLHEAVSLREPRFKQLPFKVDLAKLETNPIMRKHIFNLLSDRIDSRAYDAVTSSIDDCRALSAIYADRCGLPFVLPIEVTSSSKTPILLYGDVPAGSRLVMVTAYNTPTAANDMANNSFVNVLNLMRAKRFSVAKIVSIFDADREHVFRRYLATLDGDPVSYETIFEMGDLLRILKSAPHDFNLEEAKIDAAIEHYVRNATIAPPSSTI